MSTAFHTLSEILAEAVLCEVSDIHRDTRLSSLSGWDSMGVVFLLGEAATHWPRLRLRAEDIEGCVTVGDLADHIDAAVS